jgi:hypothetical protein
MTPLLLTADEAGSALAFLMMLFIGGCLIGAVFYSLPSFIVGKGDQTVGVLLVNLFFAWAVLGWLGCFIWAIWYLVGRHGDELIPIATTLGRGKPSCGFASLTPPGGSPGDYPRRQSWEVIVRQGNENAREQNC